MRYCILFLDENMELIKSIDIEKVIDNSLEHFNSFVRSYTDGFLMSCVLSSNHISQKLYKNEYIGNTRSNINCAIIRCQITQKDSRNLQINDLPQNSCLLKNEQVRSLFEYAPNQLIAHISPTDLLIIINW